MHHCYYFPTQVSRPGLAVASPVPVHSVWWRSKKLHRNEVRFDRDQAGVGESSQKVPVRTLTGNSSASSNGAWSHVDGSGWCSPQGGAGKVDLWHLY